MTLDYAVSLLVSIGLLVYLTVALLKPEKSDSYTAGVQYRATTPKYTPLSMKAPLSFLRLLGLSA